MPRITQKGQVTIPKEIRERLGIKPNDIGKFTIEEDRIVFTVKKGTLLDAHKKKTNKKYDIHETRQAMAKDIAKGKIRESS